MENFRNRITVEFIEEDNTDKNLKQQSKLTFKRIHMSYENYDSYTFRQNEIIMDKSIYLSFSVLELSRLLMYETSYDKLQTSFKQENIQPHCMDTDSFVLSVNTKDFTNDLKNLEDIFDFSNLNENHELFRDKRKKISDNFK